MAMAQSVGLELGGSPGCVGGSFGKSEFLRAGAHPTIAEYRTNRTLSESRYESHLSRSNPDRLGEYPFLAQSGNTRAAA
jgi:hypothetical protein